MSEDKTSIELLKEEIARLRRLVDEFQLLKDDEISYQDLLENTNDIPYAMDIDGQLTYVGPQVRRYGFEPEEVLAEGFWQYIHPEDIERLRSEIAQTLTDGAEFPSEFRLLDKEGNVYWMIDSGKASRDRAENITGLTGTLHDITKRKQAEEALLEEQRKLAGITGSAQDAVVMMDNDGNISFWNEAAEVIFGHSANEAIGRELHIFLAPERFHDTYRKGFAHYRETGEGPVIGRTLELEACRKNGEEFSMELSLSSVKLADTWHAVGIIRDITDRKKAERALKDSEQKWHSLVQNIPNIILTVERDGTILFINRTVPGYTVEETIGSNAFDYVLPEYHETMMNTIEHVFETGEIRGFEARGAAAHNTIAWYEMQYGPVKHGEKVVAATVIGTDITAQKNVAMQLVEAQEQERLKISEQLHDDLGQLLTVAKLKVDRIGKAAPSDMFNLESELSEISNVLGTILDKTRSLSRQLSPLLLNQLGLAATLRSLVSQFRKDTGIDITLDADDMNNGLSKNMEMVIFRVAQEALTNVVKHAEAKEVQVDLAESGNMVELTISDDGKGFDVDGLSHRTDCLGILSMRSRVADSGGRFFIESEPETGTTLRATIPLN